MYEIGLTHTIDAAHRVVGHDGGRGKCARLHGHTYTFEVKLKAPQLVGEGFILDYGVIKALLDEWDHRTLLWSEDPLDVHVFSPDGLGEEHDGVVRLPFNPTAENLSRHVAERIANEFGVPFVEIVCRETAKSRAVWTVDRRVAGGWM